MDEVKSEILELKIKEEVKEDPDENFLIINEAEPKAPVAKVIRMNLQNNMHDNTKVTDFQCDICKRYYAYKQSLMNHVKRHYEGNPELPKTLKREVTKLKVKSIGRGHKTKFSAHQCHICQKYLSTKQVLKGHIESHFKPLKLSCKKCKKNFSHENDLSDHICIKIKSHKCKLCDAAYSTKGGLQRHKNRFHEAATNGDCVCDYCGCGFETKDDIFYHLKYCSIKLGKIQGKFSCDQCEKEFFTKNEIRRHVLNHTVHKVECKICHKNFRITGIINHMKLMHSESGEKFPCQKCSKVFESFLVLQRHCKGHDKKFQCQICLLKFPTAPHLKTHMVLHDNPKELQCKICGAQLSLKSKLKRHMMIHNKSREKKFKCVQCDSKFYSSSHLKRHSKLHDKSREKNFKCNRCEYSFDEKSHLSSHLKSHELQDEKFNKLPNAVRCEKCGTVSKNERIYALHLKYKHEKIYKVQCHFCQKFVSSKRAIVQHFIRIHKINM